MALTQISTAGVKDDAVTAGKIPADAIGSSEIAANAVGSSELADNAVDTAAIADDAVTAAKLANTSVSAGSYGSATAIPAITVDAQGRITAASTNTVNTTTNLGISFYSDSATVTSSTGTNVSITEASSSQAGLMSTTHHDKLDGIATGANVGITDLVSDTSPQLGGDLASNSNDILMADSDKIKLGSGGDTWCYHSGNHSYIDNYTGNIYIRNDGSNDDAEIHIMARNDEESIVCHDDGAVELYHNGSKKVETTGSGTHIYGTLTVDEIDMTDNEKILLGTGDDLQIYHDGTDSHVDNNTGDLYLTTTGSGDDVHIRATDDVQIKVQGSENAVICTGNGSVDLYYDGSKKFETNSSGCQVTGILWADGIDTGDNEALMIGNGDDLQVYHDGTKNLIESHNGEIQINKGTSEYMAKFVPDGGVILYHNNTSRLETASHGITLIQGGDRIQWTASSGSPPQLYNAGSSTRDLLLNVDNAHMYTWHQNGIFYQRGANSSNGGAYSSVAASYPVRAFLNFDDEDNVVHSSGNVSSVNDTGTGYFTINWANNFPDTHYACVGTSGGAGGSRGDDSVVTYANTDHSVGSINVRTRKFTDNNMTNSENTGFVAVR